MSRRRKTYVGPNGEPLERVAVGSSDIHDPKTGIRYKIDPKARRTGRLIPYPKDLEAYLAKGKPLTPPTASERPSLRNALIEKVQEKMRENDAAVLAWMAVELARIDKQFIEGLIKTASGD
jgi:hypothetical protein